MTMHECDLEHAEYPSPEQFQELQRTRGKPLYILGQIILPILKAIGAKEHDYYGICKYYTIGKCWGGLEFGSYFICGEFSAEHTKMHELGHGLQNANVGGWSMLLHFMCSAVRYWIYQIFNPKAKYDDWYYEGNATAIGEEYIKHIKSDNKNMI